MSFLETLSQEGSKWLTNYGAEVVQSGLASAGLIKVANPPVGNLTAEQVGQGQRGSMFGMGEILSKNKWLMPLGVLFFGVVAYLIIKRK